MENIKRKKKGIRINCMLDNRLVYLYNYRLQFSAKNLESTTYTKI